MKDGEANDFIKGNDERYILKPQGAVTKRFGPSKGV
jgi:hypothetical protein